MIIYCSIRVGKRNNMSMLITLYCASEYIRSYFFESLKISTPECFFIVKRSHTKKMTTYPIRVTDPRVIVHRIRYPNTAIARALQRERRFKNERPVLFQART